MINAKKSEDIPGEAYYHPMPMHVLSLIKNILAGLIISDTIKHNLIATLYVSKQIDTDLSTRDLFTLSVARNTCVLITYVPHHRRHFCF